MLLCFLPRNTAAQDKRGPKSEWMDGVPVFYPWKQVRHWLVWFTMTLSNQAAWKKMLNPCCTSRSLSVFSANTLCLPSCDVSLSRDSIPDREEVFSFPDWESFKEKSCKFKGENCHQCHICMERVCGYTVLKLIWLDIIVCSLLILTSYCYVQSLILLTFISKRRKCYL